MIDRLEFFGICIARYILHSGGDGFISPVDLLNWLVIIAKAKNDILFSGVHVVLLSHLSRD